MNEHNSGQYNPMDAGASSNFSSIQTIALEIRAFELKLLDLFSRGKIRGTVHTCWGQEIPPAVISTLMTESDQLFGTHRGHGYFLAITKDQDGLAREILGKKFGVAGGVGGSQHLLANQILTNGIQGGLVPVAAGFAHANERGISIAVIGDGSLGQGVLYESLNIAAIQKLPLLLVIEDNEISQTTPQIQNLIGNLKSRFEGFGWKYFDSTDADPLKFIVEMKDAYDYVKTKRLPAVMHIKTRRLGPHSKGDDNRSPELLEQLHKLDPISTWLDESDDLTKLWDALNSNLDDLFEMILGEDDAVVVPDPNLHKAALEVLNPSISPSESSSMNIRNQINSSIRDFLENVTGAIFIGEDIENLPTGMNKPYNGAFGVAEGLSEMFPGKVINFPISEQAIVGFAIGRAFAGLPTLVEIMFGDFTTLIIDQIRQQASKISGVYGRNVPLPLVIRTPMGGRRGYGPTHSQNFEGLFLGIPNVVVFCVSPFGIDVSDLRNLFNLGFPVIFVENKDLYGAIPRVSAPAPYQLTERQRINSPRILSIAGVSSRATVVSFGNAAGILMETISELARKHEIVLDCLIFEIISPLQVDQILASVKQTKRLILVEEGVAESGLMGSIVSGFSHYGFTESFSTLTINGVGDIGASQAAENYALINRENVMNRITTFLRGS